MTLLGVCQYPCSLLTPAPAVAVAAAAAAGKGLFVLLGQLLQLLLVSERQVAAKHAGQQVQGILGEAAAVAAAAVGGFAGLLGWRFAALF